MRAKVLVLGLAALIATSVVAAAPTQAAGKKAKPMTLATDPAGDWGANVDANLAPVGDALGQDLVKASIVKAGKNLNFIINVNSLPASGGVPEISRYTWDFTVNGAPTQLSGAFTEYVRGTCNPTYNPAKCPPPRDPGSAPFFVRQGTCQIGTGGLAPCEEIALVHATFDAASGTITIPVPMKDLKAKTGSKIGPASGLMGGSIYSAPAVFITNTAMPNDTLTIVKTYKVPR